MVAVRILAVAPFRQQDSALPRRCFRRKSATRPQRPFLQVLSNGRILAVAFFRQQDSALPRRCFRGERATRSQTSLPSSVQQQDSGCGLSPAGFTSHDGASVERVRPGPNVASFRCTPAARFGRLPTGHQQDPSGPRRCFQVTTSALWPRRRILRTSSSSR